MLALLTTSAFGTNAYPDRSEDWKGIKWTASFFECTVGETQQIHAAMHDALELAATATSSGATTDGPVADIFGQNWAFVSYPPDFSGFYIAHGR